MWGEKMKISEESILTTKTSSWVALGFLFKWPMLIYVVVTVAVYMYQFTDFPMSHIALYAFYGLVGLYGLLFFSKLFGMKKEHAEITNQRVVIDRRVGYAKKKIILPLNHISMLEIERGFFARLFGYGTIVIYGSGNHYKTLSDVKRCVKFYKAIHLQLTKQWRLTD